MAESSVDSEEYAAKHSDNFATREVGNTLNKAAELSFNVLLDSIPGTKHLIIDSEVMKNLDHFTNINVLKEHNVDKVFRLEGSLPPLEQNSNRIYVIRANERNATVVAQQIANTRHNKKCSVILIPEQIIKCTNIFESEGVWEHIDLYEFPLGFLGLDNDILSLNIFDFFKNVFLDQDFTDLNFIVLALLQLQNMFGSIPYVFGHGRYSQRVIESLRSLHLPYMRGSKIFSHLFIFDRSIDYPSVLLTPMTYEGLLDETFDIKKGVLTLPKNAEDKEAKDIRLALNNDDAIFREIRNLHFSQVSGKLKEISQNMQMVSSFSSLSIKSDLTIDVMKKIVDHKVKTSSQERALPIYITSCEEIIKNWDFQNEIEIEHLIMSFVHPDMKKFAHCVHIIERIIAEQHSTLKCLRIMCLLSIVFGGMASGSHNKILKQFMQNFGHHHIITFHNLKKVNMFSDQCKVTRSNFSITEKLSDIISSASASSLPFTAAAKALSLTPPSDGGEVNLKNPDSLSYVFNGVYTPLVPKVIELAMTKPVIIDLVSTLNSISGGTFELFADPELAMLNRRPLPLPQNHDRIILVCFVGGVTYAEIAALRLLCKNKGCKIIVATTSLVSRNSLLQQLLPEQ